MEELAPEGEAIVTSEISLRERTSLRDVLAWSTASDELRIKCLAKAEFSFATEPYALCALAGLRARGVKVSAEFSTDPAARQRCLEGLFGLALFSTATAVTRSHVDDDIRREQLDRLWADVVAQRGCIGSGRVRYIVAREPMQPIPPCFAGVERGFPTRSEFRKALVHVVDDMKGPSSGSVFQSQTAEALLTFLFEGAHNAYEHARHDGSGRAVGGVHGIVIEKLGLNRMSRLEENGIDPVISRYIESVRSRADDVFVALTVVDVGPGIHRTLPVIPGESPFDRLNRAFTRGQTRKHAVPGVVGLGLDKVAAAAAELRALLIVKSAEILAFRSFADMSKSASLLQAWPSPSTPTPGTALTLIIPETGRQLSFLDR